MEYNQIGKISGGLTSFIRGTPPEDKSLKKIQIQDMRKEGF